MELDRLLCFNLGDEEYALSLFDIKEVIAAPDITAVPFTEGHVTGVMNLRGNVITVMSLAVKLGIKKPAHSDVSVVICDLKVTSVGILVDGVSAVITPKPDEWSETPTVGEKVKTDYIKGVIRRDSRLIPVLDISKALGLQLLLDKKTAA